MSRTPITRCARDARRRPHAAPAEESSDPLTGQGGETQRGRYSMRGMTLFSRRPVPISRLCELCVGRRYAETVKKSHALPAGERQVLAKLLRY